MDYYGQQLEIGDRVSLAADNGVIEGEILEFIQDRVKILATYNDGDTIRITRKQWQIVKVVCKVCK